MGVEKELEDFRARQALFAQRHVDNDLLRFSYNLTRPPRMADSTLISSNFGAMVEIARKSGSREISQGSKRDKALEILWRANLTFNTLLYRPFVRLHVYYSSYYFPRV